MNSAIMETRSAESKQQWLTKRQFSIGASECATALGMNRHKSEIDLWLEKIGEVEISDERNEAADLGIELEEWVGWKYEQQTGRKLERAPKTLRHPKFPFLTCNLDFRIIGMPGLVEAKTAGMTSHGWLDPEWGEFGTAQVPCSYLVQGLIQAEIDDKEFTDIPALLAGRGFGIYHIPRNQPLIDNVILPGLVRFWHHVQTGEPPPIRSVAAARKLFPIATRTEVEATCDAFVAFSDLVDAKARKAQAEEDEVRAADVIASCLGASDTLTVDGKPVLTFKTQKACRVDLDGIRAAHPDLCSQFVRESSTRVMRVMKARQSK
jgi:putative phage-type endonuclease